MKYMNCETDTCIVRMTDLFSFEWDTMFVFSLPIGNTICSYPKYRRTQKEFDRRIIFVKDSKIMYCEDERATEEPYSFYILSNDIFYAQGIASVTRSGRRRNLSNIFYTPETAVFYVTWDPSHRYYNLIQFLDNRE
jgi:hypothetical protein